MPRDMEKKRFTDLRAAVKYREKNREKERIRAAKYYNETRKTKVYVRDPYKARARMMLANAVHSGAMKKPKKCQECKWEGILHGHHEDYSKPFKVEWLCGICHGKRHRLAITKQAALQNANKTEAPEGES